MAKNNNDETKVQAKPKATRPKGMMNKMRDKMPIIIIILIITFLGTIIFEWGMNYSGFRQDKNVFGEVNGQEISYNQYKNNLDNAIKNYIQQNKVRNGNIDDATMKQIQDQVWNQMVQMTLLKQEMEKLNIKVSDDEIVDWVYNRPDQLPDWLRKIFTDSTGVFRTDIMYQSLQNKTPEVVQGWSQIEDQLRQELEIQKLNLAISGSIIVPESEVLQKYKDDNIIAKIQYAFLEPAVVNDSGLNNVSNEELLKYYNDNKSDFRQEEAVKLRYIIFQEMPSPEDSIDYRKQFESGLIPDLKKLTLEDSSLIFLVNDNSSVPFNDKFQKPSAFQKNALDFLFNAKVGDVSELIIDNDGYQAYKLLDVQDGDETFVHAQHILINTGADSNASKKKAEEILKRARSGEKFEDLAFTLSEDPSAKTNKGDLGWFGKNAMVKEFENAAFGGKPGDIIGPIKTQFGYHIIKVLGKSNKEFKVAGIKKPVTASTRTKEIIRDKAKQIFTDANKNGISLDTLAKMYKLQIMTSQEITKTGQIPAAGQNKSLMNFVFKKSVGKIHEPVKIQGGFGIYQIVQKISEGYKDFDSIKTTIIKPRVIQEKKFERLMMVANDLKTKISNGDISSLKSLAPQFIYDVADSVSMSKPAPGIGMDFPLYYKMFNMNSGEISNPIRGQRGVYIIKVESITPFNQQDYMVKRETIRKSLLSQKQQSFFQEWLAAIQEKADIIDNRDLVM